MLVGRPLSNIDAVQGAPAAIVISQSIWRNRFGSDPGVLGNRVRVNGHQFTIVGVAGDHGSSSLLGTSVEAWVTTAHAEAILKRDWRTDVNDRFWTVVCTVEPSATIEFDAALGRASTELATQLPDRWRERKLVSVPGTLLSGAQRDGAVSLSFVLIGFSTLMLLAAAANVSSMLLAAAAAERGRAAILIAIGAGRGAIIRRHLIEGVVLGISAGVVAIALYAWMRQQLVDVSLLPTLSLRIELPLNLELTGVTLLGGALAGLLLSIGPAVWVTRLDTAQKLRDGSTRTSGTLALSRARRTLVGAQVAVSVTLVVSAALFAESVGSLTTLDIGFNREGLVAMDFDLEPSAADVSALPELASEALTRAASLPGVISAAMSSRAPVDASTPSTTVTAPGEQIKILDDVSYYQATANYFDTVGLPIVRGRAFTEAEANREADLVVVNETLAARLWQEGDVLGRAITLSDGRALQVIGVARNSKYRTLAEQARPHFYLGAPAAFGRSLLVRTRDDPRQTLRTLQRTLDQIGPGLVGFFPRTLDDHLAPDMLPIKTAARVSFVLGGLALMLSGAGLYGIVMWFVAVRQREIGLRLALGASAGAVRRLVIGQAIAATAPGLTVGVMIAIALASFGQSVFIGVGALSFAAITIGIGAIVAIVLMASYLPSRRATRVDPVITLRDS